ncbi:Hypothetical protein AKI40_2496 [Enterobacter sp. FY-07]|uniref:phage tail protein n=1 Tax=Kosakonia oryzendophytica TaxID=1005665 RepID=UPI00077747BB|nr:phage tail protein [Kosakonia oryzendophytica]AMO48893.1 Hypothetical protein AKI40_2496 [Enterobacter sp. FY-07]WBT56604.1 phage tail protein [Kosakonia oryzendophytica]
MAIEAFTWPIQAAGQPTIKSKDNVRKAQFGDSYMQISGNGIHPETLTFDFTFTGKTATGLEIYAFLRRHKTKAFTFKPPFGELALWRVQADSLQQIIKSKKVISVSATFEQAFAP